MKKTLFSVLAILMVLAMVLSSTLVLSADDAAAAAAPRFAGELPDATGIVVDGKMDDAYQKSPELPMMLAGSSQPDGIYTRGTAYAAWSSAEESIYFFFIVNDISICPTVGQAWNVDGVELFVKHGDDMTLDYNDINNVFTDLDGDGKKDWSDSGRGRQYRLSGYDGRATCFVDVDYPPNTADYVYDWGVAPTYDSQAAAAAGKDYLYNPDAATKENGGFWEEHINATRNEFGWYKGGWAYTNFDEFAGSAGYTLEFKIKLPGLKAGDDVRFDFCILDRYTEASGTDVAATGWNYESAFRLENGVTASGHDKVKNYDYLTMGSEQVTVTKALEESELYDWGREDAMYPATGDDEELPYEKTSKQTMNRQPGNAPAIEPVVSSSSTTGNNSQPSGTTSNAGSDAPVENGGCGSSIVLGSSVAMLALVGAAGAFAFRKKDEE